MTSIESKRSLSGTKLAWLGLAIASVTAASIAACSSSNQAGSGGQDAGGAGNGNTTGAASPTATSSTGTGAGGSTPGTGFTCAPQDPGPLTPTFFVDFDTGDDTANGASETTPWKHAPGDPAATGNAASQSLAPGNVVLFKGGVSYKGSIAIPASGASSSPSFTMATAAALGARGGPSSTARRRAPVAFPRATSRSSSSIHSSSRASTNRGARPPSASMAARTTRCVTAE